jgi:hypothetical protein
VTVQAHAVNREPVIVSIRVSRHLPVIPSRNFSEAD